MTETTIVMNGAGGMTTAVIVAGDPVPEAPM